MKLSDNRMYEESEKEWEGDESFREETIPREEIRASVVRDANKEQIRIHTPRVLVICFMVIGLVVIVYLSVLLSSIHSNQISILLETGSVIYIYIYIYIYRKCAYSLVDL